MASAPGGLAPMVPPLAPMVPPFTKDNVNYTRLCRLLIDCGAKALRITFEGFFTPASLQGFLARPSVYSILLMLRRKRILTPVDWSKLYPTPPSPVTLEDFDITLLMLLLTNVSGLTPPVTGWNALPHQSDPSVEANLARVRYYRNRVYGHATRASLDDGTFSVLWQDISSALMGLGVDAHTIYTLRTESVDPEMKQYYEQLLEQHRKEENDIKQKVGTMEGMNKFYQASC